MLLPSRVPPKADTVKGAEMHKLALLMFSTRVRVCLAVLTLLAVSPHPYTFQM